MGFPPNCLPFLHLEDLLPALRDVVAGGEGAQGGLPQRDELGDGLVAGQLLQVGVVGLAERQQLGEKDLVLKNLKSSCFQSTLVKSYVRMYLFDCHVNIHVHLLKNKTLTFLHLYVFFGRHTFTCCP